MPAIAFWLTVLGIVLFLQLTTKEERASMWSSLWVIIVMLGIVGFAWQLLRQGTLSS